jgi:hypothetical protein
MAKKAPPKRKSSSKSKAPPPAPFPMARGGGKKPKGKAPKMPTLGGNLTGLGGTGASGMIP